MGYMYYRQRERLKNEQIDALRTENKYNRLKSLIEGEEKERLRIAKDLHDGINGDLSAIKLIMKGVYEEMINGKIQFKGLILMIDQTINQVRNISHNLAPPTLYKQGLIDSIHQFCDRFSHNNEIDFKFQYFGQMPKLFISYETAIYRVIQELLNNILKHAKAKNVLIDMNIIDEVLYLTIE